jgi:ribosomal protein S27E
MVKTKTKKHQVKRPTKKKAVKKPIKKLPKLKTVKIDLSQLKQCPECSSNSVFYSRTRYELVCRECGAITQN